jgi:hypothetical protein
LNTTEVFGGGSGVTKRTRLLDSPQLGLHPLSLSGSEIRTIGCEHARLTGLVRPQRIKLALCVVERAQQGGAAGARWSRIGA